MLLYSSLKSFVLIGLRQYFHEINTKGAQPEENAPLLIVCNHPNVVIDGLLVFNCFDRPLWTLAKGALFKGPFRSKLLRALHLIPVYRRQDNPKETSQNKDTFREVYAHFDQEKAILIFPEGTNTDPRMLTDLKTGAARIALQYQAMNNFTSPLVIQPIGLTYLDRKRFRSSVTVSIGKSLELTDWKERYEKDSIKAAKDLTEEIFNALLKLTVTIQEEEHRTLVDKIAKLYRSAGMGGDDLKRLRRITTLVEENAELYPEKAKEVEKRLDYYLALSSSLMLDGSSKFDTQGRQLLSTILVPLVMFSLIVNYPPYRVSQLLAEKASAGLVGQRGSWGFSIGVLLFPLWFICVSTFAGVAFGSWWWTPAVFCLLLISGYLLNTQFQTVALFFFKNVWPARKSPVDVLKLIRSELIDELEEIRENIEK